MQVIGRIDEVRARRRQTAGHSLGLVPTMGYLHAGHMAVVERARRENDLVAVSIFVNPAQFAPGEDLATYPRDLGRDLGLLAAAEVDLVFTPDAESMYPAGFQTQVVAERLSRLLEGASRPGHFQGVLTVVAKLFNIFQPTRAYFGQKDAQQALLVRRMAADLNFDLEVVVCPTVREPDGLALSSRNVRLSPAQRAAASALHRALQTAAQAVRAGERRGDVVRERMRAVIAAEPLAQLDYASAANPHTLAELEELEGSVLLSLAVRFRDVRLIDNLLLEGLAPAA
ncbi:MAG: pantoate--beta-alanine ligase [Candidatus Promineifilaceae bacterium]